jgi:hypothetical protein
MHAWKDFVNTIVKWVALDFTRLDMHGYVHFIVY